METQTNVQLDIPPLPSLESAIDRWLVARAAYKMHPSDENQHAYNATLFDLGAAWAKRYPEGSNTPGAFERFRRGLIAPELDE